MTDFVLIGGFWIGAWAWREVSGELERRGHRAYPLDLTGLGDKRDLAGPGVRLETHISDVVGFLAARNLDDVVLVGHSGANAVVQSVADRVPERVAGLIYVDSGPLPNGACVADFNGPTGRADSERQALDGWRLPFPPFDVIGEASLVGLDEAKRALMREKAVDEPLGAAVDPIRLSGGERADLRKWAILCTMPVEAIRARIADGDPWFAVMGQPDWTLLALPTGHWPMLSEPEKLAAMLAAW
jgi:pimeloyl-ACP methyl ester carboxylesterase